MKKFEIWAASRCAALSTQAKGAEGMLHAAGVGQHQQKVGAQTWLYDMNLALQPNAVTVLLARPRRARPA